MAVHKVSSEFFCGVKHVCVFYNMGSEESFLSDQSLMQRFSMYMRIWASLRLDAGLVDSSPTVRSSKPETALIPQVQAKLCLQGGGRHPQILSSGRLPQPFT